MPCAVGRKERWVSKLSTPNIMLSIKDWAPNPTELGLSPGSGTDQLYDMNKALDLFELVFQLSSGANSPSSWGL